MDGNVRLLSAHEGQHASIQARLKSSGVIRPEILIPRPHCGGECGKEARARGFVSATRSHHPRPLFGKSRGVALPPDLQNSYESPCGFSSEFPGGSSAVIPRTKLKSSKESYDREA